MAKMNFFLLNIFKIMFILIFFLNYSNSEQVYYESDSDANIRLKYFQNLSDKITNGKISFAYSAESGIYCKVLKDIKKHEGVFKIPEEYIITMLDIFPFKFEILDLIHTYFVEKYKTKVSLYVKYSINVFPFLLMFLKYNNKQVVWNFLKRNKMDYYIQDFTKEVYETINRLPPVIITRELFDDDDIELNKILENERAKVTYHELEKDLFNYIIENIKSKLTNYKVRKNKLLNVKIIFLFIKNYNQFRIICFLGWTTMINIDTFKE